MVRFIIERSLKFQLFAIALAFILIVVGFIQLRNMPVDALPEFSPPQIEIQTEAQGLSTAEVEELVTFNLEELLNGTPWLASIRSVSVPGLASVILYFEPGTDILRARQMVSERLTLAYALPNVAQSPVILQPRSSMSRIMMVGLTSKTVSPVDMSVIAYWNIRPALLAVPGVANVAIWGLRYKQLQVNVDPKVLQANKVKLDQVISTAGNALWVSPLSFLNASTPGSGGWIDTPQQRIEVRHIMPISTPEDLAKIAVEDSTNHLKLGDVTQITTGFPPLIGDDVINDDGGLLVLIDKYPGANTLLVTKRIEEKLAELQQGLSGINMDKSIFEPARFVEQVINHIDTAFVIGLGLLLLTLLIVIRSWRAAFISLISILASLALTIIILNFLGATLNMMVIAGLMMAVVVITNDVMVDIDKFFLSERDKTLPLIEFILKASLHHKNSLLYATIIILLTLVPTLFLMGLGEALYRPLIMSYALAIIVSMLVACWVTPALCLLLLPKQVQDQPQTTRVDGFKGRYERLLGNWRQGVSGTLLLIITLVLSIVTIGVLIGWMVMMPSPILPEFREQNIFVQWEGAPGTGAKEMVRISTRLSHELRAIPGVANVAVDIGRAVLGDKVVNVNAAQLIISVSDQADYDVTVNAIKHAVAGYPGMFHVVQTYLKDRIQQILTGTSSDMVVRIFGHDFETLHRKADEIKHTLGTIADINNLRIDQEIIQPEIAVEVDLAKAQQFGLKPGDVRRVAATLIAGLQVGSLFDEQKIFPVIVWGSDAVRNSFNSMRDILIDTPSGKWVRLDEVAEVSIKPSPSFIQHDTVSRRVDIRVDVKGHNGYAVVDQIKEKLKSISFPLEFRAEIVGLWTMKAVTLQRILMASLAVAVLIFLLLQACFESFALAAIIFFTLPFALIGSVVIAILLGSPAPIALAGILSVFAITVRNALLAINGYRLRQEASLPIMSILMTTILVIITLLPFILLMNLPGLEIAGPIAAIIVGGMITSLLYTGFFVPHFCSSFLEQPRS